MLQIPKTLRYDREYADSLLASWSRLNASLSDLDIVDVRGLIYHELHTRRRMSILQRLVTRYSRLEAAENQMEMVDLLKAYTPKNADK